MPILIKLHLFYTDNAHLSVIQHSHILLGIRLLPVVGPFDEVDPNAASKRVWDIRNALNEPLAAIASEFEFYGYKKAC